MEHCCEEMEYFANQKYFDEHDCLKYKRNTRCYRLVAHGKDKGVYYVIKFCPWCGKKLPKELGAVWDDILEKEYGFKPDDFFNEKDEWDDSIVPEEFKTDEWWKKRGL